MDNTMKSVAFHNLGCKVNGYEMDYMQQNLQERGYIVVPFDTKADIYIINTCSVTNMADRKSRQMIHRAKKMNPDSVITGFGIIKTGKSFRICWILWKRTVCMIQGSILSMEIPQLCSLPVNTR